MDKDKYFRTQNFYAASFLYSRGLELIGINKENPKKCEFVFLDTPERELLLAAFNFNKEDDIHVMIDARELIWAIKDLKNKLYQTLI